ncbi:hypothetical protein AB2L27_20080 [Kineococcus sp. LSe6-4]|uniref:Uncharacterized protein n=1 Tax=Kineococcus halophytocola TaxID=3234027 RepID=A0ABV4H636_9ACTN
MKKLVWRVVVRFLLPLLVRRLRRRTSNGMGRVLSGIWPRGGSAPGGSAHGGLLNELLGGLLGGIGAARESVGRDGRRSARLPKVSLRKRSLRKKSLRKASRLAWKLVR